MAIKNSISGNDVSISQKLNGKIQIISISGQLIYQNMNLAREKINSIIGDYEGYILDFSNITKIDSTGFGLVFNIIKRKPTDSKISAIVTDPFILELFTITKVDQLLSIYPNESVALANNIS